MNWRFYISGLIFVLAGALALPADVSAAVCSIRTGTFSNYEIIGYPDGSNTNGTFYAAQFTPAASCTVGAVGVYVENRGSPAGHLQPFLYSDSAGLPNAQLEQGADYAGIGSSFAWATSTFSGTTVLNAGTPYWVVLKMSTAANSSNAFNWGFISGSVTTAKNVSGSWASFTEAFMYEVDDTGGGGGSTSSATSSVDQTQNDVWEAYWVFFSMFALVLFISRNTGRSV